MASETNVLEKQKAQASDGLANAPLKKKIGFFSAMMVVVGSSVGAGIFFKAGSVLTNSQGSIIFAMFCWIFAAFAVISMGLALIEIASARNDNLSLIGWCQTFNGRWVYKACKNFMVYIYLPLTYFFMPLYVVMSIQDGASYFTGNSIIVSNSVDWVILMAIAVAMTLYFVIVCGLSSKMGNIQNWIITAVKFIPLLFAVVCGFVIIGMEGKVQGDYDAGFVPSVPTNADAIYSFASMTPGFGMFIAVAAIFFAYDGFYVAAGLQTEMKEPKKTPMAILFGLIIVTVIYLLIAIAMSLGSTDGSPFGFKDWLVAKNVGWIYGVFQILIGVGVLGIVNGFALWSTRFIEDLIRANEVPYSAKLVNKINDKTPYVGIVYNLVIALPIIIIFCIIGGLGYVNVGGYGYAESVNKLYSFADLMGTWTALLAFAFILFAIIGALKNRRTNLIKVEKSKFFKPTAMLSILLISLPIFFTFFAPIADLFFLFRIPHNVYGVEYIYTDPTSDVTVSFTYAYHGINGELITSASNITSNMLTDTINSAGFKEAYNQAFIDAGVALPNTTPDTNLISQTSSVYYDYTNDVLVPRIMTVVALFIFIGLMVGPELIERLYLKHKYGSVDQGLVQKTKSMASAKGISVQEEILVNLGIERRTQLEEFEKIALGKNQLSKAEIAKINGEIDEENKDGIINFDEAKKVSLKEQNGHEHRHVHAALSKNSEIDSEETWML